MSRPPWQPRKNSRGTGERVLGCIASFTLLFGLSSLALPARAEQAQGPYELRWARDLGVLAGASALWLTPELLVDELVTPSCPCDASGLNALDRGVAGRQHEGAALASDVGLALAYTLGFALDALDVAAQDASFASFLEDAVVMAQAIAINGALTQLFKITVERPRPFLYGLPADDPALDDASNYVAFYSGHTSGAFAATMSYAQTFALRNPHSPYRALVYAGATLLGAAVGALRVLSGEHFPTDVLAGAAAGTSIGLLVPWLHARARTHGAALSLRVRPDAGAITLRWHAF